MKAFLNEGKIAVSASLQREGVASISLFEEFPNFASNEIFFEKMLKEIYQRFFHACPPTNDYDINYYRLSTCIKELKTIIP